ncbi:hypothetical protein [Salipiger mangrovisoli]|uniref:Uncharacterized protein n=1 Tax=Salipiger mangrovisoli TaxID=2865933 RepID=A0ABR9X198_9RHOB|nr:hypothetical protein [Salipiger mangrovisoli]MBE9637267.1 hypothetical protein [Salipiger mangrovisoli]
MLVEIRHTPAAPLLTTAPGDRRLYSRARFIDRQVLNARRYLDGLALLEPEEFGTEAVQPTIAHIRAANVLVRDLHAALARDVTEMSRVGAALKADPGAAPAGFLHLKDRVYLQTQEAEKLLAFYRGIFTQRTGPFGGKLRGVDRIARNCYQAVWMGLGRALSVPAPQPFAYLEDGNGPATYRRGVRLSKLGKRPNPFPLVKVPQHRLHNPWTLGAIPHEVAHNLQNDLGLWEDMPKRIAARMRAKLPPEAIAVWTRWHKESFADLAGCLLIGPAYVESLIDVVGRTKSRTAHFNPEGVHPTPLLRVPLNCSLLRRMGFQAEARAFETAWNRIYPPALRRNLPRPFRDTVEAGTTLMVQAICYDPLPQLGNRALAQVVSFGHRDVAFVTEAAHRLARGENTGVLPERHLIAAARLAISRKGADPAAISRNFYATLQRV